MTPENNKWRHFLKLFDATFFKMTFQFLLIVFIGFIVLVIVGNYISGGSQKGPPRIDPKSVVAH